MPQTPQSTSRSQTAYRSTGEQFERLDNHPSISGKWAQDKNLWEGRHVAVEFLRSRGNYRRRTDMRIMYGTLVLTDSALRPDQIGLRHADGSLHILHINRAKTVWDLTRTKTR